MVKIMKLALLIGGGQSLISSLLELEGNIGISLAFPWCFQANSNCIMF
jgi:hypothetical protein